MMIGNVDIDNALMQCFARTIRRECVKIFSDPEQMARFEEWKAERDGKDPNNDGR